MSDISTPQTGQPQEVSRFGEIQSLVAAEFELEESLMEYDVPTFYVKLRQDSKQAFLRLIKKLDSIGYMPILRRKNGRCVLRIVNKPQTRESRLTINIVLFLATIATTLLTGYLLSLGFVEEGYMPDPMVGAATFALAIMAILGTHEMGHKIAANRHGVKATAPYFIPGPPVPIGIGTFGAVIVQKELPPNRDALFDIGSTGPILGFIVALAFSAIGLLWSPIVSYAEQQPTIGYSPVILEVLARVFVSSPSVIDPAKPFHYILLHPVAFAGLIGMLVTLLNLFPTGMLDGGHVSRCFTTGPSQLLLTAVSLVLLGLISWPMMLFVLFLSMYKHPGPLDDVSKVSTKRKLLVVVLVAIFLLCILPSTLLP